MHPLEPFLTVEAQMLPLGPNLTLEIQIQPMGLILTLETWIRTQKHNYAIETWMQPLEANLTLKIQMPPLEPFSPRKPKCNHKNSFWCLLANWPTVCLCANVISLGLLVRWFDLSLTYSVSWWNGHRSRRHVPLASPSDWSTVCFGEIIFSPSSLVHLLALQIGLQCVSVKSSSLQDFWLQSNNGKKTKNEILWNKKLSKLKSDLIAGFSGKF